MRTMELIDTHCHIDAEEFDPDRDAVLTAARAAGVNHIVVPAVTQPTWDHLLDLCDREPGLYPTLGLHPVYLDHHTAQHLESLRRRLPETSVVAVGEIGLDFLIENPQRERQLELFEIQLDIASDAALPVILHVRKAHDQVLATLRKHPVRGGIAHAFNGSLQQARQYIELGFKLGFGGMLTYERSTRLRTLARELPLEAIVLETDAPDLTVASHHGERNSPEYLPECLHALAQVRDQNPETVARQTTANAMEVLQLEASR
jgi:TatD DNase family protein